MTEWRPLFGPNGKPVSRSEIVLAYKRLFSNPDAALVLADLQACFACNYRSTFEPGPDGRVDPYAAAVKEGGRLVLIHMGDRKNADPNAVDEAVQSAFAADVGRTPTPEEKDFDDLDEPDGD